MIGTTEILIISVVIIVLFGASALPKFARNLGKARAEFHKGVKESKDFVADNAQEEKEKNEN